MDNQKESIAFLRAANAPTMTAPVSNRGIIGWMRANLFATPRDSVLSILVLLLLAWVLPPIFKWAVTDAVWTGDSRDACIGPEVGACWAFVKAKFGQFIYGRYPVELRWRVNLTGLLLIIGLIPIAMPSMPYKRENALYLLVGFPILAFILLTGQFGLEPVETSRWGGLLVTLVVAIVGIVVSFPLGILLALGRRSEMPIIKMFSIIFIEFWRGVPLITVLFMASVMLPLFLPPGTTFDKFLRALIAVSLFASAYMAEVIRGGLQAVPKGQYEGADSLGLGYWQKMGLIVLPQALKLVIPAIVNTFIGLFKDTSLVSIIGMFDLLGVVRQNFSDANWATPQTSMSGLVFAGFVFWLFCFGMSRYSIYMERRLDTGHRR